MINVFIAILGIAGAWGIFKNQIKTLFTRSDKQDIRSDKQDIRLISLEKFKNEKTPLLNHLSKVEEAYGKKIDIQAKELVELKTKLANVPTMEEVRNEFVSKEMFKQMEKHMDEKFSKLEYGINKILDKLEKG